MNNIQMFDVLASYHADFIEITVGNHLMLSPFVTDPAQLISDYTAAISDVTNKERALSESRAQLIRIKQRFKTNLPSIYSDIFNKGGEDNE